MSQDNVMTDTVFADRSFEQDPEVLRTPALQEFEMDLHGPEPQEDLSGLRLYADHHLQIGSQVYLLDELTCDIFKSLRKHPEGVNRTALYEKVFGGYNGYTGPSFAQSRRFEEAIGALAAIETDTNTEFFQLLIPDDETQDVTFRLTTEASYTRKPYMTTEEVVEQTEETTSEILLVPEAELLHDEEKRVLSALTDKQLYSKDTPQNLYRKDLWKKLFGSKGPSFDDEVLVNQTIDKLNAWFDKHGVNCNFKRIATKFGPAFAITDPDMIEALPVLVKATEYKIMRSFEELTIRAGVKSDTQLVPRPPATVKVPTHDRSKLHGSATNLIKRTMHFTATMDTKDVLTSARVARMLEADPDLVMTVRQLLGKLSEEDHVPSLQEQKQLIHFLQVGWKAEYTDKDSARFIDAALEAMTLVYREKIEAYARKFAGGNQTRYLDLVAAGVRGLHDGITKYEERHQTGPNTYLPLRIWGEIHDTLRGENFFNPKLKNAPGVVSLDEAFSDEDDANMGDLLEDNSFTEALEKAPRQDQKLLHATRKALRQYKKSNRGGNAARDVQIYRLRHGLTPLMNKQEKKLYEKLGPNIDGYVGVAVIGNYFGIDETRITQITGKISDFLRPKLEL